MDKSKELAQKLREEFEKCRGMKHTPRGNFRRLKFGSLSFSSYLCNIINNNYSYEGRRQTTNNYKT